MIPRNLRQAEQPADAVSVDPQIQLVEVTDFAFNFGKGDAETFRIEHGDRYVITPDAFTLVFADGEEIHVDRSLVRWWSKVIRKIPMPVRPAFFEESV